MFLGFHDNFRLAILINFVLIKKRCIVVVVVVRVQPNYSVEAVLCCVVVGVVTISFEPQPKRVVVVVVIVYCCSFCYYCYYFMLSQNWISNS